MQIILVILLAICSASFASPDAALLETSRRTSLPQESVEKSLKNCDQSQSDMNTCAEYDFVKADLELSQVYETLSLRTEERDPQKLHAAQQVWLQWRDANCEYEASDLEGGSLMPLVALNCQSRVTKDRTEWVLEMLSCTSTHGECRSQRATK